MRDAGFKGVSSCEGWVGAQALRALCGRRGACAPAWCSAESVQAPRHICTFGYVCMRVCVRARVCECSCVCVVPLTG